MNIIDLANHQLTYHVTYQKKRKSVQLKIYSSTHLEITAPANFPQASIEKILQEKCSWIVKKISHLKSVATNPINKIITHGAQILYLGESHTLVFSTEENSKPRIYAQDHQIFIHTPLLSVTQTVSLIELLLKQWYWQNAQRQLSNQTDLWSTKIAVQPKRITIKEQKTRWGSCSSKGNLNYNWRIIMAPPEVLDYLVIHELCHLRIPNHSPLFWQEVARFSPKFKQHRAWLKDNGAILMNILKK